MGKSNLYKIYLYVLLFGVFALNVGSTFSTDNFIFLTILIWGAILMFFSLVIQSRNLYIDKSIILYALFTGYCLLSITWATDAQVAVTGCLVVVLTFVIIIMFYIVLRDCKMDVYSILGYICVIAVLTYFYLVLKYGLSVTWSIRDENFVGSELYNANSVAKIYCIGAICGYEKYKCNGRHKRLYLCLCLFLIALMILSGSKTNLLFAVIYFAVCLFLKKRSAGNRALYIVMIPLLVYLMYLAFRYIPVLYKAIGYRFVEIFNFIEGNLEQYSSTWYRMSMYQNGWNAFIKKPLLGYGMTNAALYNKFQWAYESGVYLHSNFLELLVDLGICGTGIYYSIYGYAFKYNYMKYKKGDEMAIIFLSFIVAMIITDISFVSYLNRPSVLFIILACLYGKNKLVRNRKTKKITVCKGRK